MLISNDPLFAVWRLSPAESMPARLASLEHLGMLNIVADPANPIGSCSLFLARPGDESVLTANTGGFEDRS